MALQRFAAKSPLNTRALPLNRCTCRAKIGLQRVSSILHQSRQEVNAKVMPTLLCTVLHTCHILKCSGVHSYTLPLSTAGAACQCPVYGKQQPLYGTAGHSLCCPTQQMRLLYERREELPQQRQPADANGNAESSPNSNNEKAAQQVEGHRGRVAQRAERSSAKHGAPGKAEQSLPAEIQPCFSSADL